MPKPSHHTNTYPIDGIRTILNVTVVLYHAFIFYGISLDHPLEALQLLNGTPFASLLSFITTLGNIAVDIFFLLSAFLLRFRFANQRLNWFTAVKYAIFRYLRFAPAYICVSYIFRYLGNSTCLTWREAFMTATRIPNQRCISSGWTTQADFYYHILSLPVFHNESILCLLLIISAIMKAVKWKLLRYPTLAIPLTFTDFVQTNEEASMAAASFGIPKGDFDPMHPELVARRERVFQYRPAYLGTVDRIAPVFVGALLYMAMEKKNPLYRTVRNFPICSLMVMVVIIAGFHAVEEGKLTSFVVLFIHHTVGRMLVSLAACVIIILTCTINDKPSDHPVSNVLRSFFSCRFFRLLSPFTYVIYLLHPGTMFVAASVPPRFTRERMVPGWLLFFGLKWYVCTLFIGLPIWAVEWVALRGRKLVMRRFASLEKGREKGD